MCRMALFLSKQPALFMDSILFREWAVSNPDGLGAFFRHADGMKLVKKSNPFSYFREGKPYTRLLMHFRMGTGGKGVHPFYCKCRSSNAWLVAHNGAIGFDKEFLEQMHKHHKIETEIDSEIIAHIWQDLSSTADLSQRAIALHDVLVANSSHMWANVLLYNYITDSWVGMSDGALNLVSSDKNLTLASDLRWLRIQRPNLLTKNLQSGDLIVGRGLSYKIYEQAIPSKSYLSFYEYPYGEW